MIEGGTILVVDDDAEVREVLVDILEAEGFTVDQAGSVDEALAMVRNRPPNVMLLDLGLGSGSGFDVLRQLNGFGQTGVIVLSGRDDEADRVAGLELGADDYVTKPFLRRELVARVRALIRRSSRETPSQSVAEQLAFGRLVIDTASKEALIDGHSVGLTTKEFELLEFLARSPRRLYSRVQILDHVWGSSEWRSSGTVSEHVRRIRVKIAEAGGGLGWISTMKGAGYRFEPQATAEAALVEH